MTNAASFPNRSLRNEARTAKEILAKIYAFAPNRDTWGGTSYFILGNSGNILIDTPLWNGVNHDFLQAHGGVQWWVMTHRNGIGKAVPTIQDTLQCEIYLQEQEAYLLPNLPVVTFRQECSLTNHAVLLWTPGYSPGSSCLYWPDLGGVLFTGRHLLPNATGTIQPLRMAKTFHWPRQLRQVASLCDRFNPKTLRYLCPGANTGFLRGIGYVDQAYHQLAALELDQLAQAPIGP